jgi:hypothetical protein
VIIKKPLTRAKPSTKVDKPAMYVMDSYPKNFLSAIMPGMAPCNNQLRHTASALLACTLTVYAEEANANTKPGRKT